MWRLLAGGELSQREIAARVGVGIRTVERYAADDERVTNVDRERRRGDLSVDDRAQILLGIAQGCPDAGIARRLGRHRCSIGREIARNGGRDRYRVGQAEERAHRQAQRPKQHWFEAHPNGWEQVCVLLRTRLWSPEQISAMLPELFPTRSEWWVAHETIYQSIYLQAKGELRRELASCLRSGRAKRVPRSRATRARGARIKDMVMISERPPQADDRAVPGHWEGDLIIGTGNQSAIATLAERTTRFGVLIALENTTADHVAERVGTYMATLPELFQQSLTWDQGIEMAAHAKFTVATNIPVFFCDPHSPWQRGTNENFNGLVRQFCPKGTDLNIHTQADLDHYSELLNTRPRKTLQWMTPSQAFNTLLLH